MRKSWADKSRKNESLAKAVCDTVQALVNEQLTIRHRWARNLSYYLDQRVSIDNWGMLQADPDDFGDIETDRWVSWNLCRAIVDALVSRVAPNPTVPRVMTTQGSDVTQAQGQDFERFITAAMRNGNARGAALKHLRSRCLFGPGWTKVYAQGDRVVYDHIRADRVVIDNRLARNGTPLETFHVDVFEKSELIALYPQKARDIEQLPTEALSVHSNTVRDPVRVIEAIRPERHGKPGRRAVVTETTTLVDDVWLYPRSNLALQVYDPPEEGVYGPSLLDAVVGIQREINYEIEEIRANARMQGTTYAVVDTRARITEADFAGNERFKVIEGAGSAPINIINPPIAHPQRFQWLETLWLKGFEVTGLNQLAATAAKPPGLNSGVALREFENIQTLRFAEIEVQQGRLAVDYGKLTVMAGESIDAEGGWTLDATDDQWLQRMSWDRVRLAEGSYTVSMAVSSSLPKDPAGRREEIQARIDMGLIDQQSAMQLLDDNDMPKASRLMTAPYDVLERVFERLLAGKDYEPPSPMHDLARGIQLAVLYWNHGTRIGVSDERLERIAQWRMDAEAMLEPVPPPPQVAPTLPASPEAAAQLGQAQAALGPAPGGNGGMPPGVVG